MRWNRARERIPPEELGRRIRAALAEAGREQGYFLAGASSFPKLPAVQDGVRFVSLAEFAGGMVEEEDFRLFRVHMSPVRAPDS